jgi:simple sugar transport system substrate-binding protein
VSRLPTGCSLLLFATALVLLVACGVEEATQVPAARSGVPAAATRTRVDGGAAPGREDGRGLRFLVISHAQASDPFWSVVKKGADQAARDMRVDVEYQAPQSDDMAAMSELIDAAVATGPDGLVVSIPDADALGPSIRAAVDSGIPVISIYAGSDVARELGVLTHVGQTEYEAGYGGGQFMAAAGITHTLCVNQDVGNVALAQRCQGFADALERASIESEVLAVELDDAADTQQRISAALIANPDVDGILTLDPKAVAPTLAALTEEGLAEEVKLATFGLNAEVLAAIHDGEMLFAIDQQPYMQGYLPVVLLTLLAENLNTIANEVVMTSPGFVTQENVAKVMELFAQGTR